MHPVVIIGTGLAGYNVAKEFRKLNTEQDLCLVTADDGSSYSKPMLSNAFAKNKTPQQLVMADATKMAADLAALIVTDSAVMHINVADKVLVLQNGEQINYDKLVLATGALPIAPPLAGNAASEVMFVNNLAEYEQFHTLVATADSIAIIGPGLIGCEFANDLITQGKQVTVIGPDAAPLGRLLPQQAGEFMQNKLTEAGIKWQLQTVVKQIDKVGKQFQLQLENGSTLQADLVLSAIGLLPNTQLAAAAGITVNRGIVVNELLQTSAENIFALGDCAEVNGHVLPFIMPIMHASRALAKTLAGESTSVSYPAMPVLVKTPACATIVSPPARGTSGEWQVEATESGVCAKYIATGNELAGFALLGDATQQKQALTKELPAVM